MNTRFIGVKEFRQNMAMLANKARSNGERLVVLRKNEPIFEVRPFKKGEDVLTKLLQELHQAENESEKGKVYTENEMFKKLMV